MHYLKSVGLIVLTVAALAGTARAMQPDNNERLQSYLAAAQQAAARKDFPAAVSFYRDALRLEPSVPELWTNLGLMYHESGNRNEAIQSFKEAIRLNQTLFVPQLFLGIEYVESENPEAALPFLERAEKLNPNDLQATLSLGKAYSLLGRVDHAADAYARASQLSPNDGNVWLNLGMAYLQQVENDARLMTSAYIHSPYVRLRTAENFADEGKLVQANDAYRAALASDSPAPCAHAEFGITLLRRKQLAGALEQFEVEIKAGSHCGLASLGMAVAQLVVGHPEVTLALLTSLSEADMHFVQLNLPLFRGAVSEDQANALRELARSRQTDAALSESIDSLAEKPFMSPVPSLTINSNREDQKSSTRIPTPAQLARLYATGHYAECRDALKSVAYAIASDQLQLLATCSYYSGDFQTTSVAARRIKASPETRPQGLYWESKADQRLAVQALIRAGEIDAESPRMHVLLGDIFRQKRRWDDAEVEYRKAVVLDPKSHAARLSLAIALFSELKNDEAFEISRSLLVEDANDPEANLLAGEILVQRRLYFEAESYLFNCRNLKLEFMPRLHALLGQVYAGTGRIPEAISEYKAGLSTDEDGSIHYQLARLYQKSGDKKAANAAFSESQRLRSQWDERAHIALEQSSTDLSHQ